MEIIPVDKQLEEFDSHLKNNKRAILSARFGDGKTTFLKSFQDRFKDDYKFVVLHPLNYIVSSNEDIFEYIKRDILLQLVGEKEALDFDTDLDALGNEIFNWESLMEVFSFILKMHPAGAIAEKV